MFYSSSEDLRYAYSVGEIKVRENKLLFPHDLERLLSTVNPEEISAILTEAGYQTPSRAEETLLNTEDFLSFNLGALYKTVKNLSYHPEIIDLFVIRYDFRNFGVLLKNKMAPENFNDKGISESEVVVNLGLYGVAVLEDSFKKKNYELYPDKAAEVFLRVEKKTSSGNLNRISRVLDREYFRLAEEISSSNDFCRYIFRMFVDFANLDSCLRLKKLRKDISSFEECFIEGGKISGADFVDLFNGSLDLAKLLSRYSYQKIFSGSGGEDESPDLLEKKIDDFLMNILRETKFSFIGLESLIAYLLVKELEVKNIRLILQGKNAGLTREELLPHLRMTYV